MSMETPTNPPYSVEGGLEKNVENQQLFEEKEEEEEEIVSALSTQALELKLHSLRDQSNKHSQALTQKLATSQSGQNLLHIGSSLSTLPPDLHALLMQLHPVLSAAESAEKQYVQKLQTLVTTANDIRLAQRRVDHAVECAHLYQDLCAAEQQVVTRGKPNVLLLQVQTANANANSMNATNGDDVIGGGAGIEDVRDELDRAASLERAANTALCLVQDLHMSSEQVSSITGNNAAANMKSDLPSLKTPLSNDTERAYFVMKLAPRIRKLQENTLRSLSTRLETALMQIAREQQEQDINDDDDQDNVVYHQEDAVGKLSHHEQLLIVCHCLRGLAIMGKGPEAEDVFARVAIMPLIRSKLSMGRLDQGGSRGECAGLPSLLTEILETIATNFGSVLRWSESMGQVDLVTAGVWVPIATAMMADAGVKMAIFSPGIASIVQSNYKAFDTFLSELARRLLTANTSVEMTTNESSLAQLYYSPVVTEDAIREAQQRLYSHPKTAEFSKKWNLPIYYQLRFGDCCARLNTAVDTTQTEGWIANVYGGTLDFESLRSQYGFDLPLFVEVFDILHSFWRPDVFLRPLTHRFLRGAVQIIGRFAAFVNDGLEGKIMFGEEKKPIVAIDERTGDINGDTILAGRLEQPKAYSRDPYKWGEILEDVAAVAWELTVLKSKITHEIVETAKSAATNVDMITEQEKEDIGGLVGQVLTDAAQKIDPLVQKSWNEVIVNILVAKCCGPLGAVKGVAATYRMTNRPAPTRASPFVSTILRPLQQFNDEFRRKIPPHIGIMWKIAVVNTVSDRYSVAVQELIATVQRTEVALQSRRARRTVAGSMSDGEKVKLQLYLDYEEFSKGVQQVGVDPTTVEGVAKLRTLTQDAKK